MLYFFGVKGVRGVKAKCDAGTGYWLLTPQRSDNSYNFFNSKKVKLAKIKK